MLRGTKIYDESGLYNYRFSDIAPYEIISNDVLSVLDIKDIKTVENVLEKYYNSGFMSKTITYLLDHEFSAFDFFLAFGKAYETNYTWLNYNLDDLFVRLYQYLQSINYDNLDYILFLMKIDYLSYFKLRPKIWWPRLEKKSRNNIIKNIKTIEGFTIDDLYRYAMIEQFQNQYLIVIYKDNQTSIFIIEQNN